MSVVYAQLLGAARVQTGSRWAEFRPDKRYQLLAYLAYQGDWVNREKLAFLFWPDTDEQAARQNLRQLLLRVHQLGWAHDLEAERHRLRWPIETDVAAFKQALEQGKWDQVVSLYRGPLLSGLEGSEAGEFSNWLEMERESLHSRWREALLCRTKELTGRGWFREAAQLLAPLLGELDEEVLRAYMAAAFHASGSTPALKAYEAFVQHLKDELDLEPTAATQRLARAIRDEDRRILGDLLPSSLPAAPKEPAPASKAIYSTLPTTATSFVGRELELAKIAQFLSSSECHLLTLIGSGGVGKTRLALQAAYEQRRLERFEDGIYFVSLEALTSPTSIPSSLADALKLELQGKDDPLEQVIRYLEDKHVLLVLDNFEHLIEGATLISTLLQSCPQVKLLVTSRERLNLAEEHIFVLEGLPYPENDLASLEEAGHLDAVKLFAQRAGQVRPKFSPHQELPHIVNICRLVEGFPLAIELAAVWVRIMSCEEIAQEIAEHLDFLTTSTRNVPERHKSLRAAFEHSWQLLVPKEQEVLRKLSVFRGGFKREAATVVAGASIAVLAALVDKSLLRLKSNGRYDFHPLLYQYTQEKLAKYPLEKAQSQEKHAAFYFRFLQEWGRHLFGGKRKEALTAIEEELENILAAWSWAIDEVKVKELQQASEPLREFYDLQGRFQEGFDAFAQASARLSETEPDHHAALGNLLIGQAWLHPRPDDHEEIAKLATQGLELLRPLGENRSVMWGLYTLGFKAHMNIGEHRQARLYYQEALALAQEQQDCVVAAYCLDALAFLTQNLGSYSETVRYAKEAIALYRQLDDHEGVIRMLDWLGLATLRMGKPQEAQGMLEDALQLEREREATFNIAMLTAHLGLVAYALKDYTRALTLQLEALQIEKQLPEWQQWIRPLILADIGRIEIALGHDQEAKEYFLQSLRISLLRHGPFTILSALAGMVELRAKQGQIESALELASLVLHHPATEQIQKDTMASLVATLKGELAPEAFAAVFERGKARNLGEVGEEILGHKRL